MNTFSLQELFEVLIRHDAFIAHCAGFAKGVGDASTAALGYLERLQKAAANDFELKCSTIKTGDVWGFYSANYTGKVGLILRPNNPDSITFASPGDAGSPIRSMRNPVSLQAIEESIIRRASGSYNELGVMNYTVLGVFVDHPIQYSDAEGLLHDVSHNDVARSFPNTRIFCLRSGKLFNCIQEGQFWSMGSLVQTAELYPTPT